MLPQPTQPTRAWRPLLPVELRQRLGITDNLVRLSVGIESVQDLIADLSQALEKI